MSLKPIGRVAKASMVSLAIALGLTACSNDYTVSYVYMITSKAFPHGLINAYQVDYQSGFLLPLDDSPVDAGGRDTVGMAVAPNNLFLYTVNNFDSDVTQLDIGTDGKLYPEHTYNTSGSLPTAAAIDASGKFLFVTFTYQNNFDGTELYTPANPGPGGVTIFPIKADNSLGAPVTFTVGSTLVNAVNVGRNPVGITTVTNASGSFVYVVEQDASSSANLLGFTENTSTGVLTPMAGVSIVPGNMASSGFASGPAPSGILADKTGTHLYVTDQTQNLIYTYALNASTGVPTPVRSSQTDSQPMGMSFDVSNPGKYLYVAAYGASVVDEFAIGANGVPVRLTGSGSTSVSGSAQTGTGPTCVTVSGAPSNANPTHGEYLYTSNQLSGNLTGEQVNQADGTLAQIQGSPFSGSALPTCAVTVPALPIR